jgi:four helix bundle protein
MYKISFQTHNVPRELKVNNGFLNISIASMAEVKYLVYFAHRLGYLRDPEYTDLKNGYEGLDKSLWRFYETVQQ